MKVLDAFSLPTEAMGCHCHHLELSIKHALEICQRETSELHEFARHTRNNEQTRRFFEGFVTPETLQSVRMRRFGETRWSSHYFVLDDWKKRLPIYQAASAHLVRNEVDVPGIAVFERVMDQRRQRFYLGLHSLLEPTTQALDLLQANSYPTLPMVQLAGHALRLNCRAMKAQLDQTPNSSNTLKRVVDEMKRQLDERFGYASLPLDDGYIPVDYIAAALDPRTKSLDFIPNDEHEYVWDEIKRLARTSCKASAQIRETRPPTNEPNALARLLAQGQRVSDNEAAIDAEIQRFRSEPRLAVEEDSMIYGGDRVMVHIPRLLLSQRYSSCL